MVFYIFIDIIIESKRRNGGVFKLFCDFPEISQDRWMGSMKVGLRDRLVGRGMIEMERTRNCYVSFVVCDGLVAELRKKGRMRLISAFGRLL
jgi:hypothetical protein